jgi:hypothetical protein
MGAEHFGVKAHQKHLRRPMEKPRTRLEPHGTLTRSLFGGPMGEEHLEVKAQ